MNFIVADAFCRFIIEYPPNENPDKPYSIFHNESFVPGVQEISAEL